MALDELPYDIPSDNLFAPLVRAWTNKIEAGINVRKKWQNLVDEIMLFYGKSAAALFDPVYAKKISRVMNSKTMQLALAELRGTLR